MFSACFALYSEKEKIERPSYVNSREQYIKEYKAKLVTNVVGLPDDIANALVIFEKRNQWDIYMNILKERDSRYIFYRKSDA